VESTELHVLPCHLGEVVPQGAQFPRAHTAERQWVEDENDVLLAPEARQPYWRAVLIFQLEIRSLLANLDSH
jgi:hypothetical protein